MIALILQIGDLVNLLVEPVDELLPLFHIFCVTFTLVKINQAQTMLTGADIELCIAERSNKGDLQTGEEFFQLGVDQGVFAYPVGHHGDGFGINAEGPG